MNYFLEKNPIFVLFFGGKSYFCPIFGVAMSYFSIILTCPITWHPVTIRNVTYVLAIVVLWIPVVCTGTTSSLLCVPWWIFLFTLSKHVSYDIRQSSFHMNVVFLKKEQEVTINVLSTVCRVIKAIILKYHSYVI